MGDWHMPNGPVPKKRIQSCSSCKNHGELDIPKTGHSCPYKKCDCLLCRLLRQSQKVMCHQQRFWRHQKFVLEGNEGSSCSSHKVCKHCRSLTASSKKKHKKCLDVECGCEFCNKKQMCDRCRNHGKLEFKKNHKCPHKECACEYCDLTVKRRKIMKHLQRVRRSGVTSPANHEDEEAAEQLLKYNQQELSFINEPVTSPEGDCDGLSEEEIEEPLKRQSPSIVLENKKKQRLSSDDYGNLEASPRKCISPAGEPEESRGIIIKNSPSTYQSVSRRHNKSPPNLIPMNGDEDLEDIDEERYFRVDASPQPPQATFQHHSRDMRSYPFMNHPLYYYDNIPQPPSLGFSCLDFGTRFFLRSKELQRRLYPGTTHPIRPQPLIFPHNVGNYHSSMHLRGLPSVSSEANDASLRRPPTAMNRSFDEIYID